jgi:DNA replication protein DnaC
MTELETLEFNQTCGNLKELRLSYWNRAFSEDSEKIDQTSRAVLFKWITKWCQDERAGRHEAMIQGKIKSAKFKRIQTLDEFDFKHSKITEKIEKSYLNLYVNIARENLPSAVFSGNAGTGKTHLARALGYAACQKGISVLFISAAEMVNQLSHAQKVYNLETELNKYRRPQVLIIDELGYVSLDTQSSNLFFQVISARHDAGLGTIATTNLPFGKFNQIFANDAIAHAIVDRLVNEAEVFFMEGESYRQHQRNKKIKRTK